MSIKALSAAALALSLAFPTVSFAQTKANGAGAVTTDSTEDAGAMKTDNSFFSSAAVRDFFTDDSMGTTVKEEQMKAAFAKMSPENQAKMKSACAAVSDTKYKPMCEAANAAM